VCEFWLASVGRYSECEVNEGRYEWQTLRYLMFVPGAGLLKLLALVHIDVWHSAVSVQYQAGQCLHMLFRQS
jgi:hypothetical protein